MVRAWIASAHSHDFDVVLFARRRLSGRPPISTPGSSLSGTTGVVLLNQFAVRKSGVHRHPGSEVINMNPYAIADLASGSVTTASLRARLEAWHDAMVTHERRLRVDPAADPCDAA